MAAQHRIRRNSICATHKCRATRSIIAVSDWDIGRRDIVSANMKDSSKVACVDPNQVRGIPRSDFSCLSIGEAEIYQREKGEA